MTEQDIAHLRIEIEQELEQRHHWKAERHLWRKQERFWNISVAISFIALIAMPFVMYFLTR